MKVVCRSTVAMFSRLILALCLGWGTPAAAAIYSDLWYNPNESGWGANIIQQQSTLFITLFVYGTDGRSRFYVASAATATSTGFSGDLFETTGPYFGAGTFSPSAVTVRRVGTMTFTPANFAQGTLAYSVDGVSVSKSIQRQSWSHITLSGRFRGAMVVNSASAGCAASTANTPGNVTNIGLTVTANASNPAVTLAMTENGNASCTFNGTYRQFGSTYQLNTTNTGCLGTWTFTDYTVDDDAISGNMNIVNGACSVGLGFALVRLP